MLFCCWDLIARAEMMMNILKRLSRHAIRYGLKPEEIGQVATFTDEYMAQYLAHMQGWEAPSFYGCTPKHRERARRVWDALIARVEGDAMKKRSNKSARAPEPTPKKKGRRPANVPQPRPVVDEREPDNGKR